MRKLFLALCMCFCFIGCNMGTQNLVEKDLNYSIRPIYNFSDATYTDIEHEQYAKDNNMYVIIKTETNPEGKKFLLHNYGATRVPLFYKDLISLNFYKNGKLLVSIPNNFIFMGTYFDKDSNYQFHFLKFYFYDDYVEYQNNGNDNESLIKINY